MIEGPNRPEVGCFRVSLRAHIWISSVSWRRCRWHVADLHNEGALLWSSYLFVFRLSQSDLNSVSVIADGNEKTDCSICSVDATFSHCLSTQPTAKQHIQVMQCDLICKHWLIMHILYYYIQKQTARLQNRGIFAIFTSILQFHSLEITTIYTYITL